MGHDEPKVLSRALAAIAVWEHSGCSLKEAADAVVDGEGDGGIDAIHISVNPPRIYVVQSKWRNTGNATLDSAAVNKLRDGFDDLTNGNVVHLNDRIKRLMGKFHQVQMDHEHKTVVIAALLGDDSVHPDQRRGLERIAKRHGEEFFEFRNMHLVDFSRITKHGISRQTPELKVDLVESFRREPRRDRDGNMVRQESYSGTVLAKDVFDWVNTYGERLYEQNIRGSLGSTNINEKIRATLQNAPELFWTLNKGITLVADRIKRGAADSGSYSAPAHLTLPGASIVDGAQTATSVYKVLAAMSGSGLAGGAEIPIKIISLEGAPPDLAKRVTFAANTQNAILQRDFASADEAQEELEFELDQLGKRYVYKRSENLAISSDSVCRIEEVALALTCLQGDARLVGRVKKNEDALWDQARGGIYRLLFHPVPDARLAWNATAFLRAILTEAEAAASRRAGRARGFAQNADWLICHILLRLIGQESMKEASEEEWETQQEQFRRQYDDVLDRLIRHTDTLYGIGAYPEATFRDEGRCKALTALVLADLRAGTPTPQLSPGDVKRQRSGNAVHYILAANMLAEGTTLQFTSRTRSHREQVDAWIRDHPDQARVTWTADRRRPLVWEGDGQKYAPSRLAQDFIEQITGRRPKSVRGPDCWITLDGRTLTQLAEEAKRRVADTAD